MMLTLTSRSLEFYDLDVRQYYYIIILINTDIYIYQTRLLEY